VSACILSSLDIADFAGSHHDSLRCRRADFTPAIPSLLRCGGYRKKLTIVRLISIR
jgi:hypothetical protein